ncbi:outer membrane protein [Bradyrhizobium sp. AZCC 1678]|uniref:outer membrane protein n=1 Tax=Bradyrhizobium sp. AZCC 1678 TaxID=3117030 RepID=UPI002FF15C03
MKRIAIAAAVVSLLFAGAASAADLAARPYAKAPPPVAPVFSWTGFYIGGNVGGAFTNDTAFGITDPNNTLGLTGGLVPINFSASPTSVIGGVHAGYNWQVGPTWLVGIEGDFSFTSLRYQGSLSPFVSALPPANSFSNSNLRIDNLATIRGRLGWTQNQWLLYVTGGGAWMHADASGDVGCPNTGVFACGFNSRNPFSSDLNKWGWVAGVGGEFKVTNNWIFGLEYLYYRFDGAAFAARNVDITTGAATGRCCALYNFNDFEIHSVRARLSYQFGAPVVAKY